MFLAVAIPSDFELENHLSIAESAGILKKEKVPDYLDDKPQLKQLYYIAQSIRSSPVTVLTTEKITESSFYYLKDILQNLGLLIEERVDVDAYVNTVRNRKNNDGFYDDRSQSSNIFICCNIANLPKINNYEKILQNIVRLEEYKIDPSLTA
jgi:hypothetical protein